MQGVDPTARQPRPRVVFRLSQPCWGPVHGHRQPAHATRFASGFSAQTSTASRGMPRWPNASAARRRREQRRSRVVGQPARTASDSLGSVSPVRGFGEQPLGLADDQGGGQGQPLLQDRSALAPTPDPSRPANPHEPRPRLGQNALSPRPTAECPVLTRRRVCDRKDPS